MSWANILSMLGSRVVQDMEGNLLSYLDGSEIRLNDAGPLTLYHHSISGQVIKIRTRGHF